MLMGTLFFIESKKEIQTLDEQIFSQMRICSFDLKCKEYKIGFAPKGSYELYKLYKQEKEISSYFNIISSKKNSLKIYLNRYSYDAKIMDIKYTLLGQFIVLEFIIALFSFMFALYALFPLRTALHLTEEFIKDILHDFNTPLATLRLNVSMLRTDFGATKRTKRIENSVQNILNLQSNLRSYLHSHTHQKEEINLYLLLQERVEVVQVNYETIEFSVEPFDTTIVDTNRDAISRIIDNLLTNAGKYNKKDGKVTLKYANNRLIIEDTGKGIVNPEKVFERFYKEQERGLGIGLHIVQKLCDELNISLSIESEEMKGTVVTLAFK